jgi:hypothetical protein
LALFHSPSETEAAPGQRGNAWGVDSSRHMEARRQIRLHPVTAHAVGPESDKAW